MELEPVKISERAAEEIKIIMQSDEIPNDHQLRIGVKEGGCGTGGYTIGFDIKREGDIVYNKHGVDIYVSKKHLMYVLGLEVVYREDGDEWGFIFIKPNEEEK